MVVVGRLGIWSRAVGRGGWVRLGGLEVVRKAGGDGWGGWVGR